MRSFKVIPLVFSFLFLGLVTAGAADFLYYKSAQAPQAAAGEVGSIILDSDIYLNTGNSFNNLRLYDEKKTEVPFVVRKSRGNRSQSTKVILKMKTSELKGLAGNKLSLIFEQESDKTEKAKNFASELVINTPNINFERTVSVYGSNDKKQWEVICEDQPIFDYRQFIDLRNTSVAFTPKQFAYYKIIVDKVAQDQIYSFSQIFKKYSQGKVTQEYESFAKNKDIFRIDNLDFFGKDEKVVYGDAVTAPYALSISSNTHNDKEKSTDTYLISKKEPISRIFLNVKNKNFKRAVVVEATNDSGKDINWVNVASGEIFDITAGKFHKDNLKIDLVSGECRYLTYRIRVFNNDNLPLEVVSVGAEGPAYEMIFFHNAKGILNVGYGGEGFNAPKYDVAGVLSQMPAIGGERWSLGKQVVSKVSLTKTQPLVSGQVLLKIALAAMIMVLVVLIVSAVKKIS